MAEAIEQFSQVKRAQRIVRLINLICAFSMVGIAITLIIMNAQFIFGNGMGVAFVPKLGNIEIMLLLFLNFLILIVILIVAGVIVTILGGTGNTGGIGSDNTSGIDTRIITGFNK